MELPSEIKRLIEMKVRLISEAPSTWLFYDDERLERVYPKTVQDKIDLLDRCINEVWAKAKKGE